MLLQYWYRQSVKTAASDRPSSTSLQRETFGELEDLHCCIHGSLIDTQLFVAFDSLFPDPFSFDVVVHFRMVAPSPPRPVAPSLFFCDADAPFFNRLLNNLLRDLRGHFGVVIEFHRVRAPRAGDRI